MTERKNWSELTPRAKAFIVIGGIIELAITSIALRDLRNRASSAVRGPKWIWSLLCFVQPVGPLMYLTLGRRNTER